MVQCVSPVVRVSPGCSWLMCSSAPVVLGSRVVWLVMRVVPVPVVLVSGLPTVHVGVDVVWVVRWCRFC